MKKIATQAAKVSATIAMGDLVTCRYEHVNDDSAEIKNQFRRGHVLAPEAGWAKDRLVHGSNVIINAKDGDQMVLVQLVQDGNKMYKKGEGPVRYFKQSKMIV